ncbi:MAG TPA: ATP synthase delta/epsilon chain alpha-helix domain-containing protein, partial [Candidatus Sulfotelmatobacter sp.]|nr:ATP synthase delta/epsilon chain alpha-helix domain-containing protein [Candidatus Sulfotelmatobacter sp.]
KAGVVTVKRKPQEDESQHELFVINGGLIEVANNKLRILVDEADRAQDINEAEAQKALERAQKMHAEAKDQVSLDHAQQLVDRYQVRLQVANIRRRHHK